MSTPTAFAATDDQLRFRLGLRSSNAAQKHQSQQKRTTRPGHGQRRQENRKAIAESRYA
jgi:hypothetical protein